MEPWSLALVPVGYELGIIKDLNFDLLSAVCVAYVSIQQLHYEMANNLMKAMEIKLRKTYIAQESKQQHGHAAVAQDD